MNPPNESFTQSGFCEPEPGAVQRLRQYTVRTHTLGALHRLFIFFRGSKSLNPTFAHDQVLGLALLDQLGVLAD
ncbi:hypothetical protein D3C81_2105940 [compost metagenome]